MVGTLKQAIGGALKQEAPAALKQAPGNRERGSAVAEFVLIAALGLFLALAVFQLAFALHIRVTLIDCAGEGARAAATIGADPGLGVERTRALITSSLHPTYTQDVRARVVESDGLEMVEVTVSAPLPLLGYFGPSGTLQVSGHAVVEEAL